MASHTSTDMSFTSCENLENTHPTSITGTVTSKDSMQSTTNGSGDIVLAKLKYQYCTFPLATHPDGPDDRPYFSLADDPCHWMDHLDYQACFSWMDSRIEKNLNVHFASEPNGAAQLLAAIMWSKVLENYHEYPSFFDGVRHWACHLLFSMGGAPDEYLVWIQGVTRPEKSRLKDVTLQDGAAFFKVNKNGDVHWVDYSEGLVKSDQVVGELPALRLRII